MRTLINLISEQTMQNLLPILALRPDRVVSMRSPTAGFNAGQITQTRLVRGSTLRPVGRMTASSLHFSLLQWL